MVKTLLDFNEVDRKIIKDALLDCILKLLPQIINEIAPIILQQCQHVANSADHGINDDNDDDDALMQGLTLIAAREKFWSELIDKREDKYYKFTCDKMLLNLSKDGMQKSCINDVPCILGEDETEAKNNDDNGKNTHLNKNAEKAPVEAKILGLETGCEKLRQEIDSIDYKINTEIFTLSPKKSVVYAVKSYINEKVKQSSERINEHWTLEIDKLKKVGLTDVRKYNDDTIPCHVDIDSCVSSTDLVDRGTVSSIISTDSVPLPVLKITQDFTDTSENNSVSDVVVANLPGAVTSRETYKPCYTLNPQVGYTNVHSSFDDVHTYRKMRVRNNIVSVNHLQCEISDDDDDDDDDAKPRKPLKCLDRKHDDKRTLDGNTCHACHKNFTKHPFMYSVQRKVKPKPDSRAIAEEENKVASEEEQKNIS